MHNLLCINYINYSSLLKKWLNIILLQIIIKNLWRVVVMENNQTTTDFLTEIYKGARIGVQSINNLLTKVNDSNIYNELKYQLRSYEEIANEAYNEIIKRNNRPKDISAFDKLSTTFSIGINTFINNNPSNVADMMIKGNTMGVTEITKNLNAYKSADENVKNLADKFVKLEQDSIERLKKYL